MKTQREIIKKVLDYIENNLETKMDLDSVSKSVGYSKYHLNRLFTEEAGCTIYKYIQLRRLTDAAKKLVETDKQITQIAYDAGYNSQQAFTFAFRQIYECTPQSYRKAGIFKPKQARITLRGHMENSRRVVSVVYDLAVYRKSIYKTEGKAA